MLILCLWLLKQSPSLVAGKIDDLLRTSDYVSSGHSLLAKHKHKRRRSSSTSSPSSAASHSVSSPSSASDDGARRPRVDCALEMKRDRQRRDLEQLLAKRQKRHA